MEKRTTQIDMIKLSLYILKRIWLVILCAAIGFGAMYWYSTRNQRDTYTASGTMYVYNGNPNVVNYQYTSYSDITSAVRLIDTYMVVVKSNKVLDAVVERLAPEYPNITPGFIKGTLSMGSVDETGVVRVSCVTGDPQMSADICNAVMDVAPSEIIRVVSAGSIEIVDYAVPPTHPDAWSARGRAMRGAMIGAVLAGGLLVLLFLLNRKVTDTKDLTDNYTPPVLASVRRYKEESKDPSNFLLNDKSPMETVESYAKLRMNLLYTLVGKENNIVAVTSAISGEGKSTIAANLAISSAMSGKRVLLVDGDMRRCTQREIFKYSKKLPGLSNVLIGECTWQNAILGTNRENMFILPGGRVPPNPAELLSSGKMDELLVELGQQFDLVLLDLPPVNIVSDPLVVSAHVAGCLFVTRQNFSDHREIRKALNAAELTNMNVLGFVFYGEKIHQGSYYYSRKYYYKGYYHHYDTRGRQDSAQRDSKQAQQRR